MQQNGTLIESFLWLVLDNDLLVCVWGGGVWEPETLLRASFPRGGTRDRENRGRRFCL